ncbi:hypothetical protein CBM2586_A50553 [Cupriavidus phytorum]|uniref:Uncharacterized protein n=1 Tax=Cupriavidus taiwanensis TaxID=164546 RepID=A0A976A597_9BURK|nr:hypothetical protein CBM2586_A50553 [Cupriavidus taiwanensis]
MPEAMLGAGATSAGGIAAGRGRPRRVKEQIFRTRHGCRCSLTSPGGRTYYFLEFCDRAPVTSSQAAGQPAGRHRFPVRAGLLSPKRMPAAASAFKFCFT